MRRVKRGTVIPTVFLCAFSCLAGLISLEAAADEIEDAIKELDTIQQEEKSEVIKRLVSYGSDAVAPLLAVATDRSNIVSLRSKCIYTLGEIKDPSVVDDLILLASDEDAADRIRKESARALGKIGESSASAPLVKLLDEDDEGLRFYSLVAVGRLGDKAVAYRISEVLLNDPNEKVRAEAIRILDEWDATSESSAVMHALSDRDTYVRGYAVQLCGIWKVKNALPKVIQMLQYENDIIVKVSAAQSLGAYGGISVVPALIDALDDMSTDVRISAADALELISGKELGYSRSEWQKWYDEVKPR